jgi:polyisoprenoid-binding protein YceI
MASACERIAALVLLSSLAAATAWAEPQRYGIDPGSSSVVIHVGKAGLFGFAGHEHEVVAPVREGTVVIDRDHLEASSVELTFDAAALRVTGKGEPAGDVPKVQQTMVGPECLDAGHFPTIRFVSRTVTGNPGAHGGLELVLRGDLTLHGVSRELHLPIHVVLGADTISATGSTKLRQTAFGIQPVSVAGVVKVKDELDVEWRLVGAQREERALRRYGKAKQ